MRYIFLMCLMLAGFSPSLSAAHAADTGLERFKAELVGAYRQPDAERIRSLLHPKSLACLQAEQAYERYLLRAETMQALPRDAKISIDAISPVVTLPFADFTFPVRPSHVVHMEYGKQVSGDGRSSTTQIADKYLARSADRWYLIMPCPTPEGMGRLREMGLLD